MVFPGAKDLLNNQADRVFLKAELIQYQSLYMLNQALWNKMQSHTQSYSEAKACLLES